MRWLLRRLTLRPPEPAPTVLWDEAPRGYQIATSRAGLPSTFRAIEAVDPGTREQVLDPALQHLPQPYRPGDPTFSDSETARRWFDARRRATDHVLRLIAESHLGDQLVLRGSRLMPAFLGDEAREPGDLDWVTRSPTARPSADDDVDIQATIVFGLLRDVPPRLRFDTAAVASEDIWAYARASGRRFVFPWQVDGLPGGLVQVDVVFGEPLAEPPERIDLPLADGDQVTVWAATAGLSLAWKFQWLVADVYPEAKDLYDGAMLARRVFLPLEMLRRSFPEDERVWPFTEKEATNAIFDARPMSNSGFPLPYSALGGDFDTWADRLLRWMSPTFVTCGQPASSKVIPPEWQTPDVVAIARRIADDREFGLLPILGDALEDAGCTDEEILGHCREAGPHDQMCWLTQWLVTRDDVSG